MSLVATQPARRDVGFGTAYERWAIYRLLTAALAKVPGIKSALEGPIDGMAGIPGLHLLPAAQAGARVTVVVPDQSAADIVSSVYRLLGLGSQLDVRVSDALPNGEKFDLVMTFNALPFVDDWPTYVADLGRRCRSRLIVSVTNRLSYGVGIRRIMRLVQPGARPMELFDHPSTLPHLLEPKLGELGRITADQYVDCPWWPDLFVETGQTLFTGTVSRLPGGRRWRRPEPTMALPDATRPAEKFLYGPERFPFFGGLGYEEELLPALQRHPGFDVSSSRFLQRCFAHHRVRTVAVDAN